MKQPGVIFVKLMVLLLSLVACNAEPYKLINPYAARKDKNVMPATEDIRSDIIRQLESIKLHGRLPRNHTINLREIDVDELYSPVRQKETKQPRNKRDEELSTFPVSPLIFVDMGDIPASIPCKPRTTIANMTDITGYKDLTFHPPCMFVTQCDGCCGYRECVATVFERKRFLYLHRELGNESRRHFDVEFDKECKYQCHEKAKDCTPAQVFNKEKCRCECPYTLDCDWAHHFIHDTCKCECIEKWPCRDPTRFSEVDCKCHNRFFYFRNGTRPRDDDFPEHHAHEDEFLEVPPEVAYDWDWDDVDSDTRGK